MARARSQILLWILTTVLAAVLLLLVVLQVRWADRLWHAEIDRLQHEIGQQLDTLEADLGHQLVTWGLGLQVGIDATIPSFDPARIWNPENAMSATVRDVYLMLGTNDSESARWLELRQDGTITELAEPPSASHGAAWIQGTAQPLPYPLDDEQLMLRLVVPDTTAILSTPVHLLTSIVAPQLLITLDRGRFDAWLEVLAAQHWGDRSEHLRYAVIADDGEGEAQIISGALEQDGGAQVVAHIASPFELHDAIGDSLTLGAEGCGGNPACRQDGTSAAADAAAGDATEGAAEEEAIRPIFLSFPSGDTTWRFEVQVLRGALDTPIRELWVRNLAIGFVALGVLGVAIALLIALAARAQRLAWAQFDFVTGVSHELRTPLSVLRSAAANLEDGLVVDVDQNRRYGRLLRKEVGRLQELVERILGFTRAETVGDEAGAADLADSIARVTERLRAEIADREVDLEVQVAADLPAVATPPWMLDSVLQNLLSNALKYGGERVRIEGDVVTRRRRPAVSLTVRDWGPGLSRSERRRVFEPFFRGRLARDQQLPGAGLGLSWVARLAQRTGGRLIAESRPGQGSRFGVVLPAEGSGR